MNISVICNNWNCDVELHCCFFCRHWLFYKAHRRTIWIHAIAKCQMSFSRPYTTV